MVLKKDGTVWATGWNYRGQLGDERTITSREDFVKVVPSGQCGTMDESYTHPPYAPTYITHTLSPSPS